MIQKTKYLNLAVKYGFIGLLILMMIGFTIIDSAFISIRNLVLVLQSISIIGVIALGVTVTLVVDGFDLSVGSTAAFSMMLSAYSMVILGYGTLATILLCLIFGMLVGLINGFLIVKMHIPDLLATLSLMFLLLGLQLIPTEGRSISAGMMLDNGEEAPGFFTDTFLMFGRHRIFETIPVSVVVLIVVAVVIWLFLDITRYGRVMYAIGSNPKAAEFAGANIHCYKVLAYIISGVMSAIAGILLAARMGRGDVSSGNSLLLDAVAASLVGFAVLGLGKPNAFGTAMGALFVGLLLNGLTMLNAPYYTQDFIKGLFLVIALMFTFKLKFSKS